ncbi:hypothetical protein TL16_g12620 [Triparma laevis f. inornata]|uniref:Uncharacterized protein n=1 Tax=Triparma laevis f. inornata TaxID=1714386 RepID=A0A9W7EX03_9STRA|nr:hypothetical protein TL16_g12620 [Triparma laevis f. inornata]
MTVRSRQDYHKELGTSAGSTPERPPMPPPLDLRLEMLKGGSRVRICEVRSGENGRMGCYMSTSTQFDEDQ